MSDTKVTTSTVEKSSTTSPTPEIEVERTRHTSVQSSRSDRVSAWNVRDFVKAMDAAGVPDRAYIEAQRSDVGHLIGLSVRFSETLDQEGAPDGDA